MASGTRLTYSIFTQPYSPDKDDMIALLMPVWTTANFADVDHEANTDDKFLGKAAWDSTLNEPVFATGPLPADAWERMVDVLARDSSAAILHPSATTAELEAIGDAINTLNKRGGKIVWNSTTSLLVVAQGATAGSTWFAVNDNLLDHTPV